MKTFSVYFFCTLFFNIPIDILCCDYYVQWVLKEEYCKAAFFSIAKQHAAAWQTIHEITGPKGKPSMTIKGGIQFAFFAIPFKIFSLIPLGFVVS